MKPKRCDPAGCIRVELAWSPGPRQVERLPLELPAGSTVGQALAVAGKAASEVHAVSIWSVKAGLDRVLQDGDRVELCGPLRVDPKVARRERFAQQGSKTAGLFAQERR